MAKTTKIIRGIQSWIKFQKHQGVQSLTIKGKDALADLSQDKQGDTDLILNADKDKLNSIQSVSPFISISEQVSGTDPNREKTATLDQDLTKFNLGSDGLIDVSKTPTTITLYTSKIIEKINEVVNSVITASETKLEEKFNKKLEESKVKQSPWGVFTAHNEDVEVTTPTNTFQLTSNFVAAGLCRVVVYYNSAGTEKICSADFFANNASVVQGDGMTVENKSLKENLNLEITLSFLATAPITVAVVSYHSNEIGVGILNVTPLQSK